jgi:hypothetical protein
MIQDIELIGVEKDLIEKLMNNLEYDEVLCLACNHENVKKIIDFFKNIGIKNIDELLLNRYYIFLKDSDSIVSAFNNIDLVNTVLKINDSYDYIDEII